MSGGRLVVMDRAGRDVKRYSLPEGLVTLGSDPACDIRLLLPTVSKHHATVVVRSNQTIVRNVSNGETLVNGRPVSVAALKHGDTITLGDRSLRWEYDTPASVTIVDQPTVPVPVRRAGRGRGGRKRASDGAQRRLDPAVHLMLELNHRASMPGAGKQVAIVQPQRRDNHDYPDTSPRLLVQPHRPYAQTNKRQRNTKQETPKQHIEKPEEKSKRKTASPRISPKADLQNTTKATLWIESRKTSPRKSVAVTPPAVKPPVLSPRRAVMSAKRATPLRTVVLRKAMTPNMKYVAQTQRKTPVAKVAKIQAPSAIDHTKQAALMLMAGHPSKTRIISPPQPQRSAALGVKRPSPVSKSPTKRAHKTPPSGRKPGRPSKISMTPKITPGKLNQSGASNASGRRSRSAGNRSATILEISDSDRQSRSTRSVSIPVKSPLASPALHSPRKSALKDPARASRKTDSKIHFDLSNLESFSDSNDVLIVSNTTKGKSFESDSSVSDSELTLHYSDTSQPSSPSPRRSLPSRSSRILGSVVGTPLAESTYEKSTLTPDSPNARNSMRGSLMIQKVLDSGKKNNSRYSQRTTTSMSDGGSTIVENRTKTVSPRSPRRNMESYSIVDLVSIDSNDTQSSEYGSVTSHSLTFGTPQTSVRKTRSTIDAGLLGSSTPYVDKTKTIVNRSNRSSRKSSPIKIASETINDSVSSRRSKSLTTSDRKSSVASKRSSSLSTPENAKRPISINSTRISRSSRRTMNETDLLLMSAADDDSPKTSKSVRMSRKSLNISLSDSPNAASARSSAVSSPRSPRVSTPVSPRATKSPRVSTPVSPRAAKSPRVSTPISPRSAKSPRVSTPISSRVSKSPRVSTPISPRAEKSPRVTTPISARAAKSPRVSTPISPRMTKSSRVSTPISPGSAKSSRKSTAVSLNLASPITDKSRRGSRKTATITLPDSPLESGLHTPENTHSPENAGTPVLSIKSLLDSSQSSFVSQVSQKRENLTQKLKRKTIGTIRSEPRRGRSGVKSKSLNLGAGRRSLIRISKDSSNMSDKTDEGAIPPSNDDTITPKSTVKLIQEAVKEKHSTAKKPQSKRSIIDHLNDSDIVKQLFSSPVKRKLSQSMTEFSRKHSLELKSNKKRTRNTIALGRTPDVSFSDHTVAVAPEEFVSPLNTPENSPNLTGIKRLFRKNTPHNDLTNIKGVKSLLKTPRTRKSIKNDLTNVAGVKDMFVQKSPRNSLSNVRGVKSLFQHQKKGRKSTNDLTDVRGVKQLYKGKSPKNDLQNVSGVKTLTRRSPKNNLEDVRGVKKLFRREKSGDGLSNLSGVEALFDTSFESDRNASNTDIIFDQLVGKPAIKSTYAKSFSSKSAEKAQKRRAAKSLNVSFDLITNNVEDWLERELQKRVSKHDSIPAAKGRKSNTSASSPASKSRKSLSKSNNASKNATRELQNLLTDTVEGTVPIRTSRVRTSTLIKSIPDVPNRRSASETYGAHTLPIKKRSFVEASLEKSANHSKAVLPIKKRALVHSTPVKGQWNMTADASALGRVSPIVADKTRDADLTSVRTTRQAPTSPKTKPATPKKTKSMLKQEIYKEAPKPQLPPKKNTRTSKAKVQKPKSKKTSPVKEVRTTRGRKTVDNSKITNTKKRRSSLVITKKSPILSPAPNPNSPKVTRKGRRNAIHNVTKIVLPSPKKVASPKAPTKKAPKKAAVKESPKKVTPPPSPKKTRGRGKAVEEKPATPKSRGRPKKSNVITKATQTKGQPTEEPIEVPKPKRGRNTTEKQISEEVVEPRRGKGRKTESLIEAPVEKTRRGRKVSEKTEPAKISEPPKRGRNAKVSEVTVSPQNKRTTRGRKTQAEQTQVEAKPKRGRSAVAINDSEANTTKGRKRKATLTENVVPAKTAKKSVEVIETTKATRGRKIVTETKEVKTQGGKLKTPVVKDSKIEINISKAEGKSVVTSKSSRAETKVVEVTEKKTRGAQKVQKESKPARGKKAVVETAPKGRKRKSDPEPSPVKGSKKEPVRKTRKTVEVKTASPAKARPTRRLKELPKVVTPKATRSKRR